MQQLQEDCANLRNTQATCQKLETENQSLEQRVNQLESRLKESQANANITSNVDTSGMCLFLKN